MDYFDPKFVEGMLRGEDPLVPKERDVDFVIVRADETSPTALPHLVKEIVSLGLEHAAVVESIVSNLVVMTYGAFPGSALPGARERLATTLQSKLGSRVAVLHGKRTCLVGPFGSETRMEIGSQIPRFSEHLRRLTTLDPGEVEEV